MALINIVPADPNVRYAGKTLPGQAPPYSGPAPTDPNVPYDGAVLPAQGKQAQPYKFDPTNIPQLVVLGTIASVVAPFAGQVVSPPTITGAVLSTGGIVLPGDVLISITPKKVLSTSNIIDGVEVTQHIRRRANLVKMEFTARALNGRQLVFAQDFLDQLYQKIYLPATVLYVQNTMLNKMGIQQLVMDDMNITTVRGSINIPITMNFRENIPGKSLII